MFDLDKWQEIGESLWRHKVVTFLTAFFIFWGIFMLIVLLGAGKGLQNGIYQHFSGFARNAMWVWTWKTSTPYEGLPPGRLIQLEMEDYHAIRQQVEGVEYMTPRLGLWATPISRNDASGSYDVIGVNPEIKHIIHRNMLEGRFLNENDVLENRKVIVLGKMAADILFENEEAVGKYLSIRGAYFQVVGVYKSLSIGQEAKEEEESIYMPISSIQQTYNMTSTIGQLILTIRDGYDSQNVEEQIHSIIASNHQVDPEDNQAIRSWSSKEEFETFNGLFTGIQGFIWMVSIGTLFAASLAVGVIMMIIVKERTREIGIRKALGATPWSIISLIMTESLILTVSAGFMGLMLGVFVIYRVDVMLSSLGVENDYFANPEVNMGVAFKSLAVLVIMGLISGFIPALRAARVNPVVALRTE